MTEKILVSLVAVMAAWSGPARGEELSLASAPPVVVRTAPEAGSTTVDPALTELRVTFSKPMVDRSWSWSTWGEENFPETTGEPRYLPDQRTCVLPVRLKPGKFYATWLNSAKFTNFQDTNGVPAVPYLLSFRTAGAGESPARAGAGAAEASDPGTASVVPLGALNENQRLVVAWTDRQFRAFFDSRNFTGWSEKERAKLEARLLDTLNGPRTREYYQAINSLGALHAQKAVAPLLAIAAERREKDCRDRWMAIRALGTIGDRSVVPELIHLVYHGNINTRWWAQIALVQLTGANFGGDWKAWGKWWTDQGGQPPFSPEFVVWYSDPQWSDPARIGQTLAENDQKFFENLRPK